MWKTTNWSSVRLGLGGGISDTTVDETPRQHQDRLRMSDVYQGSSAATEQQIYMHPRWQMCLEMSFTQMNQYGTQLVNRQPSSIVIGCIIHDGKSHNQSEPLIHQLSD